MQHGFPVFQSKANDGMKAILNGVNGRVLPDHPVRLFIDDGLHQLGQILKIIIKGVAVDAAVIHNVPYGDLTDGPLIQQLDKRVPNRRFCKGCHGPRLLPVAFFPILQQNTAKMQSRDVPYLFL